MRIKLAGQIGKNCNSLEDGLNLYQVLLQELKNGNSVELDFEEVETVYTPFLIGAFGRLFDYFDKEFIISHISLCQLPGKLLQKINCFLDEKDRMDTNQTHRETLTDLYDEDKMDDFDGP